MKHLHKFYNKEDLSWVQLIWSNYYSNGKLPSVVKRGSSRWRSIVKLLDQYKGISDAEAGVGDTILFWTDLWNGQVLQHTYPQLFSFALNKNLSWGSF
jgi:hypothetical protein